MNEGYLGKFTFEGERAATDDHPVILHALPLASTVTAAIPVGALLKKVDETIRAATTESATATKGADNTGVSAATVTAATFKTAVSNKAGNYVFTHDGTGWKLAGQTVTLTDYGLAVTGTPASGDTVTVAFTAAVAAVVAANYAPLTAGDSAEACAVADKPCDPTGTHGEKSVIAVVHGTVKTRLLTAGGSAATEAQLVTLMEHGIFAV